MSSTSDETNDKKYVKKKCIHNKQAYHCIQCKGAGICQHDIRRNRCVECHGSEICQHDKIKHRCKDCKGISICEHNKQKSQCRDCDGVSFCEHGRRRNICKDCKGRSICEHNRIRNICKDCKGRTICEHDKRRNYCPDCNGSSICKSKNDPYNTGCRTLGNRKLKGFCSHCFVNIFPDDPLALTVRKKSKEIQVVTYILSKFSDFIHDKPFYADLQGGCCSTKRRIDLRKLINNTMLCIEIDEDQHKSYIKTNESARYDDLFMDYSGKYIFIRYNPDKFIDKYNKCKNPFFETRMDVLEKILTKHITRIENNENEDLVEIYHIFYDETI